MAGGEIKKFLIPAVSCAIIRTYKKQQKVYTKQLFEVGAYVFHK
jgi:hypothetical protein